MDTRKKGLQRLTEIENKIAGMLNLPKIKPEHVATLTAEEHKALCKAITDNFNTLKGKEKDCFLEKVADITTIETKNEIWEYNHLKITRAISSLMQAQGKMPTKMQIAEKTELSRFTIHKHLQEYNQHPLFIEQVEQFRFMIPELLAKVYAFAVNGDLKAAKLYFDVMGCLKAKGDGNTFINNQQNVLSIQTARENLIKKLTDAQLARIISEV